MTLVQVPVSLGEVVDKITILRLKERHIAQEDKRANILTELRLLEEVAAAWLPRVADLTVALQAVNARLWEVEDDIRACEYRGDFGPDFITLARAVYHENDRRAALKREINLRLGSTLVEEKSYTGYARPEETP